MSSELRDHLNQWVKTPAGTLRHISGLTFLTAELPGRKGDKVLFKVRVDVTTLEDWETYELASGTPITRLRERKEQLEAEALAYVSQ